MSNLVSELNSLKFMVTETLAAGSNYLFAKYDSVIEDETGSSGTSGVGEADNARDVKDEHAVSSASAYNRILSEMAGLSAAQTVEQIDKRRREISAELTDKIKISTISDFDKFRQAIQKLNCTV